MEGYITRDYEGAIALSSDVSSSMYAYSIIEEIKNFAISNDYLYGFHSKGLGGDNAYIPDCNLRVYYTDNECTLEEAMESMDVMMNGGDIVTKINYLGYSEYTITGLEVEEFTIGGHDLEQEISSHCGQYAHIIIED